MKTSLILFAASSLIVAVGCAAPTQKEARSTAMLSAAIVPAPAAGTEKTETTPEALPATCSVETKVRDAKACLPPVSFAKKLCSGVYPEVALGMFAKGTPWTRLWLAGDVDAWNASGGLTHRAKLAFDEEIIVLARHGAASMGGITMSGAQASFDVLRWDGSCVSVMEGELTSRRPPAPKPAPVAWNRLEETTRHALLSSPKVKATHDALDRACSVSSAKAKKSCEKADKAFTSAVVDYVRAGAALPAPARRP